jgi:hypothetical protein
MADDLKRFRIHFKSKAGDQFVTLMARNKAEAEVLAAAYQSRRATRYPITQERLAAKFQRGEIDGVRYAAEKQMRERDFSRYDIVTQKEVGTDENGEPVLVDEVAAAEAPLKLDKISEVKN